MSWPSPPHLETYLAKAGEKDHVALDGEPRLGGQTLDDESLQQNQQRPSLTFFKGEEWIGKKEKQNPKCQRNFSGMKFLHHLENI